MGKEIDWVDAQAYEAKHAIFEVLNSAFEDDGGCGHDLGLTGVLAVVRAWERIRTPEMVRDLKYLK